MDTTNNNNAENFTVTGDWTAQTKSLKERFRMLTDADLSFETGKENEMLGRVGSRLNKDRAAVLSIIRSAAQPKAPEGPSSDPTIK